MASRALAGFIGGFADTARAGLERRELEEAEKRKAEMLNRLRMETDKEMALFADKLEGKKVSKDNSSIDLARGVRVNRNAKGEVIGETQLTPTELEANRLSLEGSRLDAENIRSTIKSRSLDDARQDRVSTAQIGMYNRSGKNEDDALKPMSNSELAKELLYQNEALVTSTLEATELSRDEVEELAYHVMQNAKGATPQAADDDANRRFRMALRHMAASK